MAIPTPSPLDPSRFIHGESGQSVLFPIATPGGLRAAVCAHGARLLQLVVPDREGRIRDVVLGYDSLGGVLGGIPTLGVFVGRYANRIRQARFALEGRTWQLSANDGPHCIHGGPRGSRHQMFRLVSRSAQAVTLGWTFREDEDGFPGDVDLAVCYALSDPGTLSITWEARVTGRSTVLNFTPHPFFNLEGNGLGSPGSTLLQTDASQVLRLDATRLPTGDIDPVAGGPLDFRDGQTLDVARQALGTGIDHCLVVPPGADGGLRRMARAHAAGSGLSMEVWSDAPAIQVYSGHGLSGELPSCRGKEGHIYGPGAGFCLEPQQFPDAPNQPNFPSTVVPCGETRRGAVEYRFCADPAR